MAYRRSSGVKFSQANRTATTGKGTVITKPRGLAEGGIVIPPPDDGYIYVAMGSSWIGRFTFNVDETIINGQVVSTKRYIGWDPANVAAYPMFEGAEEDA